MNCKIHIFNIVSVPYKEPVGSLDIDKKRKALVQLFKHKTMKQKNKFHIVS